MKFGISIGLPPLRNGMILASPPFILASRRASAGVYLRSELQFRVLMTAAASVLMQELRLRLARTASARAQVSTLRQRFLKLGAQVVASIRRIVLHLPKSYPYLDSFRRLALSLGAQTG